MGHFSSTYHRGKCLINSLKMKVFAVSCLLALAGAAPAPDAEADPQFLAAAPYAAVAAPNCKTEVDVLVTQKCTPTTENVCTKATVDTEEIEYEKVCQDVVSKICDGAPVVGYHALAKREADAEADPQFYAGYAHHVAPVAHAVAHTVEATVKHACREVTTEHCVDNPKVKAVPVDVETCHTVTKVTCEDINNEIPKTICEPVETKHLTHHGLGYAGYAYGK